MKNHVIIPGEVCKTNQEDTSGDENLKLENKDSDEIMSQKDARQCKHGLYAKKLARKKCCRKFVYYGECKLYPAFL